MPTLRKDGKWGTEVVVDPDTTCYMLIVVLNSGIIWGTMLCLTQIYCGVCWTSVWTRTHKTFGYRVSHSAPA